MKADEKKVPKPTTELRDCAKALRDSTLDASEEALEWLIGEGYLHLRELEAATCCNEVQINALRHRINHAEEILQRKRRLARSGGASGNP